MAAGGRASSATRRFLAKAPEKVVAGIRRPPGETAEADIARITAQLAALPQQ